MKCSADDCPDNRVARVAFPWAEPVDMCERHLAQAKQLMVNLNRSEELRVIAAPVPDPEEPAATPAAAVAASGVLPPGALELVQSAVDALDAKVTGWLERFG